MANNYFDMTGVLVLNKVTPVIKALFDGYELDESYPGNGEVYIAHMSEGTYCGWDSVLDNLKELAKDLGLKIDSEKEEVTMVEDLTEVVSTLAEHFNASNKEELLNMMEQIDNDDYEAELDCLFIIARAFDDGHGLKAYKTECAWHCSKPRLFEFGGCGNFEGSFVSVSGSSNEVVSLGEKLEAALASDNTVTAADILMKAVGSLLDGIYDANARDKVRMKLIQLLSA